MEQQTSLLGLQELRSEAESSSKSLSDGRSTVRQPSWPGDNVRTGSSSRQPILEVVCISLHRWNGDGQGTYALIDARYVSGHRRSFRQTDLAATLQFLGKRCTLETRFTFNEDMLSLLKWLLHDESGARLLDAYNLTAVSRQVFGHVGFGAAMR